MYFLADNTNEYLEKYMTIWEKISNLINKNFDSDPVYKDHIIMILLQIFVILIIKIINYQKKTNPRSAYH